MSENETDIFEELTSKKDAVAVSREERKPVVKKETVEIVSGVIPVDKLKFVVGNRGATDDAVANLAESIKKHGVLVPIIIDSDGKVLDGERRVRACRNLGIKEIPYRIKNNKEHSEISMNVNYVRENLTADQVKEMIKSCKKEMEKEKPVTQEEVAKAVGLSQSMISKLIGKRGKDYSARGHRDKSKKNTNMPYTATKYDLPKGLRINIYAKQTMFTFQLDNEQVKNYKQVINDLLDGVKDLDGIIKTERARYE